jgi:hypothetical protein
MDSYWIIIRPHSKKQSELLDIGESTATNAMEINVI